MARPLSALAIITATGVVPVVVIDDPAELDIVKLFPAVALGGLAMLDAIAAVSAARKLKARQT